MRIVSLLPSATEIVAALGLETHLVGITHECDYPPSLRSLPAVTESRIPGQASSQEIDGLVRERLQTINSLYELKADTLQSLQPDLVITQSLCEVCAVALDAVTAAVAELKKPARVVNLNPECLQDVLDSIQAVGKATKREQAARDLVVRLQARIDAVRRRSKTIRRRKRALLLEWIDPPFSAGHWTPELLDFAGAEGLAGKPGERSRELQWDEITALDPEVLVVVCCGFDVPRTMQELSTLEQRPGWFSLDCVRREAIHVIDGSAYFNRPGPRLVDGLEMMASAIYPETHPLPEGLDHAFNPHRGGKI
ncbi:MAG: cobalamin-binding protein [Aureliella sp.]